CHLGFYKKNVLNLYITSFNAEFSAFSPGNLMMAETIMAATDKKLRKVDFLRGDEDYKQHFANRRKLLSDFIGGRSLLGKFVVWVFKTFYID
ncbi:MAG: GNAT family N-acetyltransferase, partial [Alphaproteobacteria bacterium]|nr:GNAT family N-acetyltransferase [Alphaproteobacteria bacterium]